MKISSEFQVNHANGGAPFQSENIGTYHCQQPCSTYDKITAITLLSNRLEGIGYGKPEIYSHTMDFAINEDPYVDPHPDGRV